jgi:hypothetical protein
MRVRLSLALSVLWDLFRIPILHRDTVPAPAATGSSDTVNEP